MGTVYTVCGSTEVNAALSALHSPPDPAPPPPAELIRGQLFVESALEASAHVRLADLSEIDHRVV